MNDITNYQKTTRRVLADELRGLADKLEEWEDGTPLGPVTDCMLESWSEVSRTHITVRIEPMPATSMDCATRS